MLWPWTLTLWTQNLISSCFPKVHCWQSLVKILPLRWRYQTKHTRTHMTKKHNASATCRRRHKNIPCNLEKEVKVKYWLIGLTLKRNFVIEIRGQSDLIWCLKADINERVSQCIIKLYGARLYKFLRIYVWIRILCRWRNTFGNTQGTPRFFRQNYL